MFVLKLLQKTFKMFLTFMHQTETRTKASAEKLQYNNPYYSDIFPSLNFVAFLLAENVLRICETLLRKL